MEEQSWAYSLNGIVWNQPLRTVEEPDKLTKLLTSLYGVAVKSISNNRKVPYYTPKFVKPVWESVFGDAPDLDVNKVIC